MAGFHGGPVCAASPVGAQFLTVPLSVWQLGMGGVGVGGRDILRAWSNPAVRTERIRRRQINVVERSNMERILAEQTFQQSGCTTEECAVKLGNMLNVQRMVVGSFGRLLSTYIVSIRVVDVQSGGVLFSEQAKGRSEDELSDRISEMAIRLSNQLK